MGEPPHRQRRCLARQALARERGRGAGGTSFGAPRLAVLLAWELLVIVFGVREIILPRPSRILAVLIEERALLVRNTWVTLYEVLIGFALSVVVGIALAVAIVHSRFLEKTLYPLIVAFQNVPRVAVGPLLVIWLGSGIASKSILVLLVCFFPIVVNAATGLKDVRQEMINLLLALRASRAQIFWKVRLPNAFPYILSGMKIAMTLAVIGAIIGEFIAAEQGLGLIIMIATAGLNTPLVMAAIALLVIMGGALYALMSFLADTLAPWRRVP
ncbi:MAG: ABC transporter permease [Alphaproteobacteria bacterium]|nr:MAG: ABC transporter permease [Alphaproteobacteria bacterium]